MFIGEVVENKIYGEVTGNWYDWGEVHQLIISQGESLVA